MFQLHDKTSRTAQLVDQLRSDILSGILPPGARLRSMRDMAAELNVSKQVVESAYETLLEEDLIQKKQGPGGTCVKKRLSAGKSGGKTADLLLDELMFQSFSENQRAYFSQNLVSLLQFRLSAHGVAVHPIAVSSSAQDTVNLPVGPTPVILYGRHVDRHIADYERQLVRRKTGRYIFLDYPCSAPRAISIVNDHVGGGRQAAEYFLRMGCRRLAFAGCDDMPNHQERWEGFSQALREGGMDMAHVIRWHDFASVVDGLATQRHNLDGVFFAADWLTIDICNHFRRQDIDLQRALKLVSFDNTAALHHAGLEIPVISTDRGLMVDTALQAIFDPTRTGVVTLDVNLVLPSRGRV